MDNHIDLLCKGSFKMLFDDNSNIVLLISSVSGRIVNCNIAAQNFYKYTYEELTSLNIKDINTLPEQKIISEMNYVNNDKKNYFNFIHKLSTGEFRRVEVKSCAITIDGNNYLFSIINDISDNKKQQLLMNCLFYDSHDAIIILDENKKVLAVNKSFTKMFGYRAEEIMYKQIDTFIINQDQSDLNVNFNGVMSGKEINKNVLRRTRSNKMISVKVKATPCIIDSDVVGALVVYKKKNVSTTNKTKYLFNRKKSL